MNKCLTNINDDILDDDQVDEVFKNNAYLVIKYSGIINKKIQERNIVIQNRNLIT